MDNAALILYCLRKGFPDQTGLSIVELIYILESADKPTPFWEDYELDDLICEYFWETRPYDFPEKPDIDNAEILSILSDQRIYNRRKGRGEATHMALVDEDLMQAFLDEEKIAETYNLPAINVKHVARDIRNHRLLGLTEQETAHIMMGVLRCVIRDVASPEEVNRLEERFIEVIRLSDIRYEKEFSDINFDALERDLRAFKNARLTRALRKRSFYKAFQDILTSLLNSGQRIFSRLLPKYKILSMDEYEIMSRFRKENKTRIFGSYIARFSRKKRLSTRLELPEEFIIDALTREFGWWDGENESAEDHARTMLSFLECEADARYGEEKYSVRLNDPGLIRSLARCMLKARARLEKESRKSISGHQNPCK